MRNSSRETDRGLQIIWGIFFIVLFVILGLSIFTYDWRDISLLMTPAISPTQNWFGPVGAWLAFAMFGVLGLAAYLLPFMSLYLGVYLFINDDDRQWPRFLWGTILLLSLSAVMQIDQNWMASRRDMMHIPFSGGCVGVLFATYTTVKWLNPVGAGLLLWSIFACAFMMFIGFGNIKRLAISLWTLCLVTYAGWMKYKEEQAEIQISQQKDQRLIDRKKRLMEKSSPEPSRVAPPAEPVPQPRQKAQTEPKPSIVERLLKTDPAKRQQEEEEIADEEKVTDAKPAVEVKKPEPKPEKAKVEKKEPKPQQESEEVSQSVVVNGYKLPPVDLLNPAPKSKQGIEANSETTGKILVETLAEFGIETEVVNVETGPVVTRYELLPAPGVKLERISALSNNLALALKAQSIRVQAPVPGKGVVGIEVPNTMATMVCLREVFEGDSFKTGKHKLPLLIGKDVGGADLIADLADMPHILIAGSTGSGKTVCMNSILAGLLMARRPDELRLMLVDPKIVEFSGFNNLPHLVVPVITNPKKVTLGLRWAINEMEKRYKLFAKAGVRNIDSYNRREKVVQGSLFGDEAVQPNPANEMPSTVPYIVIVIDELADLMLADGPEIENCVARLAQLSRAVGIHMILSTQRPSVNVITGTIKANFPSRIAFQVAQKVDSRTILDTSGADKLLGRGDMLYLPPGVSKLIRAQGAYTTDEELKRIVEFIKAQSQPTYEPEIQEKLENKLPTMDDGGEDDELITQCIDIIRETKRASTSLLQRRLRIGYTRAARVMDILEERGIIGPPRGSDPREILLDLDGEIPSNSNEPETEQQ